MRSHAGKNRRSRRGQAIVEMAVCLVAILAVIGGFLLITGLGLENIQNAIRAREDADQQSRDGIVTASSGRVIRNWDYGQDGTLFTRDDRATDWSPDVSVFLTELKDETDPFDMKDGTVFPHISADRNFAANLSPGRLFLAAAELASVRKTETDPLGKRNLTSFRGLIRSLITNPDFTLEDSAAMPVSPILSE